MTIREEVLEALIDVMREARERGRDDVDAARAVYPDTPESVLWEAWAKLEHRQVEAWWEQVERTIDGEIVRKALIKPRSDT